MKKKEIRIRCWIDIDGVKFFGPGRAELLELIESEGSLAKAAKSMGMSYKKAWDMAGEMNTMGQKPLIVLRKGGEKGGGAELTETGKALVQRYHKLITKLNETIKKEKDILKMI